MPPRERGEILRRAYELIMSRIDDLALLMTLEMGKPIAESKGEITYAAEFFRWFAEEAVRIDGQYAVAPNGASRFLVMRQPVGVCLLVTPWNFPMAMGTRKIGPAVAAGCTMVIKPAQQTPLSMHALAAILAEAGLPDGVLNVVTTSQRRQGHGAADPRRAGPQAVVHRVDRASAARCWSRPPTRSCGRRWSSAATPRSWCSPTPTSTPPSRAR